MPSSSGTGNFVEISDHAVIVIRAALANGSIRVETWREIALQNRMEAAEAVRQVFPEATGDKPVSVHCAVRPAQRCFKIASADEARQHGSAAAARALVASSLPAGFEPAEIACIHAHDGRLLGGGNHRWFAAATPRESLAAATAMLGEWNLKAERIEPAAFGMIGASQAVLAKQSADEPLLIWDAAPSHSDFFLVSSAGVEATRRVDFGFEHVFEALMAEIQLKFKGAAVRLFFNERYDFTEAGPKIAARAAGALQEALAALTLQAGGRSPATFCAASLPSKQSWFARHLAAALQLKVWQPDLKAWAAEARVTFADPSLMEQLTPSALGPLNLLAAARERPDADAWHGAWIGGATEAAAKSSPPAPAPAKPATAAAEPAKPAPAPARPAPAAKSIPAAKPATSSEPVRVAAKAAVAATAEAARPGAKRPAPTPAFPAPAKKPAAEPTATPKAGTTSTTPVSPGGTPPPAKSAQPAADSGKSGAAPRSGNRLALIIGVAAAVVLGGGGFLGYTIIAEQKAAALREKQDAERRAAELAEANRLAQLKAEAEAEARRRAEEQAAAQARAAEEARKQAELEAQQREAERIRLLNARGSLVIKTEPSDAMVTVGNLAPRPTPAAFHDLRLGKYQVEITKPGYEVVHLELEVKENVVFDPGEIPLVRQTGSLTITSTPSGVSYSIQPLSEVSFSLSASDQNRGVTPATVEGLPTGEYAVTLERPGWAPVTKNVTISGQETATVSQEFMGGIVSLTTFPEGAEVFANNVSIGRTPLTLSNVSPGTVSYRLELPDHIPATVSGTVEPEKTLDLTTFLVPIERLARISDLGTHPRPIKTVQPNLPKSAAQFRGERVLISLVIDTSGEPRDWRIIETPDEALAELCIEAIAQWRFEPATIDGKPVKVRVTVPLVLN